MMDQSEEKQKHPLTGEPYDEEAERAKLIPADEFSSSNKENQQAFQKFVDEYLIPQINYRNFDQRSVPQELFFAREVKPSSGPSNSRRVYFKKDNKRFKGFREASDLTFEQSLSAKGLIINFNIHSIGEELSSPYEELDSFNLNCDLNHRGEETMYVQSKINSRVLRVRYWQGGTIDSVEFNSDLRLHHSDDVTFTSDTFEKLKVQKPRKTVDSRGAEFEIIYDKGVDAVKMVRVFEGRQSDRISIPMKVDFAEIQKKVLSGPLIDNPVKASLDEDDQWRLLTLRDLGINWQRE